MKTTKPTILHISKFYYPVFGGLERFIFGLTQATQDTFNHIVMCYNVDGNHKKNNLPQSEIINHTRVFRINFFKISFFRLGWFNHQLLKEADVIHLHNSDLLYDQLLLQLSILQLKKPIFISSHGFFYHHSRFNFLKYVYANYSLHFRQNPDVVIISGYQDFQNINKLFSESNHIYFPNPMTPPPFKFPFNKLVEANCLFISRIQASKQIPNAIYIYHKLRKRGFTGKLQMILSGSSRDIDKINGLHGKNFKDDDITVKYNCSDLEKWEILKQSYYYLNLSSYEGFGYGILEALVTGCKVFVSEGIYRTFANLFNNNRLVLTEYSNLDSVVNQLLIDTEQLVKTEVEIEKPQHVFWDDKKHIISNLYLNTINK